MKLGAENGKKTIVPGVQAGSRSVVGDRGISVAQAARDLDLHENVLHKWRRLYRADLVNACPGTGHSRSLNRPG